MTDNFSRKTDTYSTVKERIESLLNENNLSIHKLSILSGVSPSTIKNILYFPFLRKAVKEKYSNR